MNIDFSQVTTDPWFADESHLVAGTDKHGPQIAKFDGPLGMHGDRNNNCAITALLRNMIGILAKRRWGVLPLDDGQWYVCEMREPVSVPVIKDKAKWKYPNPLAAVIEAERWMRGQESKKNGP